MTSNSLLTNSRERFLALILGFVVVGFVGFAVLERAVITPIQEARSRLKATRDNYREKAAEFQLIERAEQNLRDITPKALPGDAAVAALLYQDWLSEKVQEANLREPFISPGALIAIDNVGRRIPFTVEATGTLASIGRFIDAVLRANLLHRITFVSIDNAGPTNSPDRRLTFLVEALSLDGVPHRETLSDGDTTALATSGASLQEFFANSDPFRRGGYRPDEAVAARKPSVNRPSSRRSDPIEALQFVGSVATRNSKEAWFFERKTERKYLIAIGEQLVIETFHATVTDVTPSDVVLSVGGELHRVKLGEFLRRAIQTSGV